MTLERGRALAEPVRDGPAERPVGAAADFDDYVAEHRAALVRYAFLLCGSAAQAEDLVQDVLVRLFPRWASLDDPHPYVRRSVTNEFLSWRRRWSTRHVQLASDAMLDSAVEPSFEDGPDPELWARLGDLPPQQRAAVVLRFWEDLDDEEIGRALRCKPATVRGHVSRGLARLRTSLDGGER